jgi:hypothetical protein
MGWPLTVVKKIALFLFKLTLALSIVFGLPFWWIERDVAKTRSFCTEATQGTSLAKLAELAKEYGIDGFNTNRSLYNKMNNSWLLIVPSNSTMGEYACFISHDGVAVIQSTMDEPKSK